jgi:ABC-2 type transport system permease protein
MRMLAFAKRCSKEILRDPINLFFGIGFPVVLLILMSAIQANIPTDLFNIERLAPGITVFGLSFITLFAATLVARDRETSFLQRLYTTPLSSIDFIMGYMLPLIPISVAQSIVCYLIAIPLGLKFSINIVFAILSIVPISVLYISLGLLFGSILNVKQASGICGGLMTNLAGWLSGIWFDLSLVGGAFEKVAGILPFKHAVELEKALIAGNYSQILPDFIILLLYIISITFAAILLFLRQMKRQ